MPWSEKQMRALQAKAHGADLRPGLFEGIGAEKAAKMAEEGIDHSVRKARRSHEIDRRVRRSS